MMTKEQLIDAATVPLRYTIGDRLLRWLARPRSRSPNAYPGIYQGIVP